MKESEREGFTIETTEPSLSDASNRAKLEHSSGDRILSALCGVDGLVGDLVKAYPGAKAAQSPEWLDKWVLSLALVSFRGEQLPPCDPVPATLIEEIATGGAPACKNPFRIISIEPRYFRGFRVLAEPINLNADLVVIEGRNSHGKTSLAESLEWLFTGALSRRDLGAQGNARELEGCIGNHFRPNSEETWVEASLKLDGGGVLVLRRVLAEDYGSTATSRCVSRLRRNGVDLTSSEERTVLEELMAGTPPLLMQHTLGQFIHSGPTNRRHYFERLIQLEELTELVEKAVMGARASSLRSPVAGSGRAKWEELRNSVVNATAKSRMRTAEQAVPSESLSAIKTALAEVAVLEHGALVTKGATYEDASVAIQTAQREARRQRLPILTELRPKRTIDGAAEELLSTHRIAEHMLSIGDRVARVNTAHAAAKSITRAERIIAECVAKLIEAGLIPAALTNAVTCPVCEYVETPTLTSTRVGAVQTWEPARIALAEAERQATSALAALKRHIDQLSSLRIAVCPGAPTDADWDKAVASAPPSVATAATEFKDAARRIQTGLSAFDQAAYALSKLLRSEPAAALSDLAAAVNAVVPTLKTVADSGTEYSVRVKTLEAAIGSQAKEDKSYARRAEWLDAAADPAAIAADFAWTRAVKSVQDQLDLARSHLMAARQQLLDRHRMQLTDGFTNVWTTLRADRYSAFSQLSVPEPRGKGFKVEIEVKARLDDGLSISEVDALRIFSESQVNVLGIAAFVTRARLLGHKVLVFDDPVQSMDEDHFKTFAGRLLPVLVNSGFQVILLTHNDTFARDVSYAHAGREKYVTISISHARKTGCRVDLDSRRLTERLNRARKEASAGNLSEAWKVVRLAIERLYLVAYIMHGPTDFKSASWVDQSAESMFNQGVSDVIEKHAPGMAPRLKEILSMTAAGAHDKKASGETDLEFAVRDLKTIRLKLGILD